MIGDLTGAKVGDKLFVKSGHYDKGSIVTVDRITPTGRIVTKHGEFNPNGRKRGSDGWQSTWARLATEDDVAGIFRLGLVSKIERFRAWDKLSADDLKTVSEIVSKYQLP